MPTYSLPIPPSVNHVWKRGRTWKGKAITYRDEAYMTWLQEAGLRVPSVSLSPPYRVTVAIHGGKGWRKGRDADNALKGLLDLLRQRGVIQDDAAELVREIDVRYCDPEHKKSEAQCVVTVESLPLASTHHHPVEGVRV